MAYAPQRKNINNIGESLKLNDVTFGARIGTTPTVSSVERNGDGFK